MWYTCVYCLRLTIRLCWWHLSDIGVYYLRTNIILCRWHLCYIHVCVLFRPTIRLCRWYSFGIGVNYLRPTIRLCKWHSFGIGVYYLRQAIRLWSLCKIRRAMLGAKSLFLFSRRRNSNPQPLWRESSVVTTMPGCSLSVFNKEIKKWKSCQTSFANTVPGNKSTNTVVPR